jgi:LysM repeat protein
VSWNGIELDALLQPGQTLNLEFANAGENVSIETLLASDMAIYIVRRGDSMAKIARRFNAALDELLVLNQMVISEVIYPGQQIKITTTEPGNPTL